MPECYTPAYFNFSAFGNLPPCPYRILLTIFAMLAELERDFVSERTKEGLRSRRE